MRIYLLIISILILTSCIRTHEKLITAVDECRSKEDLNDMQDARDEYDTCMLFTDEELKTTDGCLARCKTYCEKKAMNYDNIWIDFGGCRCSCKLRLG